MSVCLYYQIPFKQFYRSTAARLSKFRHCLHSDSASPTLG